MMWSEGSRGAVCACGGTSGEPRRSVWTDGHRGVVRG